MYSILITGFYILFAFIISLIVVIFVKKSELQYIDNDETESEDNFKISRMPLSQHFFVNLSVCFIFLTQVVIIFPFVIAFNKLRYFVFLEGGFFIFLIVLGLWYTIQKNMLRIKE